jgi:phage FluMu gp28-like protein
MTKIQLPPLRADQAEIARHPARFKVLANGRRWGKTTFGILLAIVKALSGLRVWWVAPDYGRASQGWEPLKQIAAQIPGAEKREDGRIIKFPGFGFVQVKSADDPDSLRGVGLDFVIIDEAAFMQEEAWTHALRPALSDRQGGALIISTPRGRNWFWHAYQRGLDPLVSEWQSWSRPTSANHLIPPSEIAEAKATLPEFVFAQEYLAEFQDNRFGVFRNVQALATATQQESAQPDHVYYFGVDFGRYNDFTCIAVIDATIKALVYLDRFNDTEWALQRQRIAALAHRFKPQLINAESNSMGEPNIEALRSEGLPMQSFTTTNLSKQQQLVYPLALAFESGELTIIPDPVLLHELQAYQADVLPSGALRYSHPSGGHDDTAMALMLGWSLAATYGSYEAAGEMITGEENASWRIDDGYGYGFGSSPY